MFHKARIISITALSVLLACSLLLSNGCSPTKKTNAEVISNAVATEFNKFKDRNETVLYQLAKEADINDLERFDIDPPAFVYEYLDGFDYSIDSINVNGDNAEARVSLTARSFSAYEQALNKQVSAYEKENGSSVTKESEAKEIFKEMIMTSIDEAPVVNCGEVVITFKKDGNTWNPSQTTLADVVTALMAH